jgi:phospholipid/cholesterol/gamma-HCH transport system substrate-binding protein
MKNSLETRIGIFVAMTALAAVFILEMTGGVERFTRGNHYRALFDNVQDLKVGDRVKMAGVEIGRVEDIELAGTKVQVRMKIKREATVKTDSVATIKFTGLMGQYFVSIEFGSSGAARLENNQVLITREQPDLNAIMGKLDSVATGVENLTKSFTGDKIDSLFGPLIDVLKDNRDSIKTTMANMQSISTQIAHGEGTVGKLIYDQSLYNSALATVTNLQDAGAEVKSALADARQILAQVNSGQGTIGKLVKDETLFTETTGSMTNLREILQKINQGQGSIGKLVNDQEFYKNIKLTLQKLDKATEGLEDQGPLSVLGIAVNSLF